MNTAVHLLHEFIYRSADTWPENNSIKYKQSYLTYEEIAQYVIKAANGFIYAGVKKHDRIAIFLPKCFESIVAIYGASAAGSIFVPITPGLKSQQVLHILQDSRAHTLVTSADRLITLKESIIGCKNLKNIILIGGISDLESLDEIPKKIISWTQLIESSNKIKIHRIIDTDIAALLYTSGSTGRPKGVILSHKNIVTGTNSVAQYLENNSSDRILSVLPLSFDYGLNQISTALSVGACAVLLEYLLPMQVIKAVEKDSITGLAAVPPLWTTLAQYPWTKNAIDGLRYITSSGGAVPAMTINLLRKLLPNTKIYLMYGLTEAFRSTYLSPEQIDIRPNSIGKAIPNADVYVLREDGSTCLPGEPGELVHRGSLVSLGYWNDPELTSQRFRPYPQQLNSVPTQELAVWTGDIVTMDDEGYLYFIGRNDDQIKTLGYRLSPNEVEEVIYSTGMVSAAVAFGVPHPVLGQSITVVLIPKKNVEFSPDSLIELCKQKMPSYMIPAVIEIRDTLPTTSSGKFDRKRISEEFL